MFFVVAHPSIHPEVDKGVDAGVSEGEEEDSDDSSDDADVPYKWFHVAHLHLSPYVPVLQPMSALGFGDGDLIPDGRDIGLLKIQIFFISRTKCFNKY